MFNIPDKTDGTTTLPASQFNSLKNELINLINIFLAIGGDDFQIARSISDHVAAADFYVGGGIADAYILTRPNTDVELPSAFNDGMRVRFIATATNSGSGTGVTVDIPGIADTPKAVKRFDGSALPANAIVIDELTELVYLKTPDFFILGSSSDTRMITQNTTLTVAASGADFTTVHDAYESLRNQYITDNARVFIDIEGNITETENLIFSHPEGGQINISGPAPVTVDIDAVNNVSGGAGAFSIEYLISASFTTAAVGDYLFIHDTIAGGPNADKFYNKKHEGLWEITAITPSTVTVTNKFGFAAGDAPKTSDLAAGVGSGKITFVAAQITYSMDTNFFVTNTHLGGLLNIVIINKITGVLPAFLSIGANINTASLFSTFFFGVVTADRPAFEMNHSILLGNITLSAISDNVRSFQLDSSQLSGSQLKINSNASGGDISFLASKCNIVCSEIVVCGCNGATMIDVTTEFRDCFITLGTIFSISNKVVGVGLRSGRIDVINTRIFDNKGPGLEVWGAGAYTSFSSVGSNFDVRGNVGDGVRVTNSSTLQLGADEFGGQFEIVSITITGHTNRNLVTRMGSSASLFAASGNVASILIDTASAVIHNAAVTVSGTADNSTGGYIVSQ